jgi:hypothetical protein
LLGHRSALSDRAGSAEFEGEVQADETTRHILTNLLNAVKYSAPDSAVRLAVRGETGASVRVRDAGGIRSRLAVAVQRVPTRTQRRPIADADLG